MKKTSGFIFPLMLFALLAVIFFGKTLIPGSGKIIYGGDLLSQFYYWKGFLKDSLLSGFVPFWNPYLFSGTPFLAHPSTAFFYPATFIYLLFPLNISFSLVIAIHLLIAFAGMYRLAGRYADPISSAVAAAVFAFSGYYSARIYAGHIDLLTTSIWLPWIFLALISLLEKGFTKKRFITAVTVLSLLILAGYNAYLVFSAVTAGFFAAYFAYTQKSLRPFLITAGVYLTALALTAVQWLPTWQLTGQSIRAGGFPYDLASWGSLSISSLDLFFTPFNRTSLDRITFNLGGGPKVNPFDHFTGSLPLISVGFFSAVFLWRKLGNKKGKAVHPHFWLFTGISLFFLWIALGPNAPFNLHYFLYTFLPFYRFIRIPIQNLIIPVVFVPVLTGIVLSKIKYTNFKLIIGFLMIGELILFSRPFVFLTNLPAADTKLLTDIKTGEKTGRFMPGFRVVSPLLQKIDMNAPMMHKIYSTSGYDPVILKNYHRFADSANKNPGSSILWYNVEIPPLSADPAMMNFLGVKRILLESTQIKKNNFSLVNSSADYAIYGNSNSLPRFFPVSQIIWTDNDDKAARLISDREADLISSVVLEGSAGGDKTAGDCSTTGKVNLLEYLPNRIRLTSDFDCPVWLSSSEVYYPGWSAKIDGKTTRVIRSNLAFRTIFLPAGFHQIEYIYHPIIYLYAGVISLISFIVLVVVMNIKHEIKP